MLNHQSRKKGTIDATSHVVPSGNRNKRSTVIIDTDRVVESGSFGSVLAKTHHPFGTVVEPPRGTEPETWRVSRKWGKFATRRRCREWNQKKRETRVVAAARDQRLQGLPIARGLRSV